MMSTLRALSEEEVIFVLDMFMREKSVLEGLMVWTQDVGWVVPLLDNFCVLSVLHPLGPGLYSLLFSTACATHSCMRPAPLLLQARLRTQRSLLCHRPFLGTVYSPAFAGWA